MPCQEEKAEMWRQLNDRETVRPLVYINEEPWSELSAAVDELQEKCGDPFLRSIEREMRVTLYRWRHYPVDMVVRPVIDCPRVWASTGIGIAQKGETIAQGAVVSQHFDAQISAIEDVEKIKMPIVTYDKAESLRRYEMLSGILDGVAPVRLTGIRNIWFTPWDFLIRLVDIQSVMMDLIMRPDPRTVYYSS